MISNPFHLTGKTVLITGAASGIGRSTAQLCALLGANLVLLDINSRGLEEVESLIGQRKVLSYSIDLTSSEKVDEIVASLPEIDGVVSNAGIVLSLLARFNEQSDLERIFKVNTFSHIGLIQSLIRYRKLNKKASIVFTSSMSGTFCGIIGGSLYGATKAALTGYAKALALELAPRGIRVNSVHPGMVETSLTSNTSLSSDVLEEDVKKYPLGRYGKPEDVSATIAFLLSDATVWMTGSQILLDGGYSLR